MATKSHKNPRWNLNGVPGELKRIVLDHLWAHRNMLIKENASKKLKWCLTNDFKPKTSFYRDGQATVRVILAEEKQRQLFQEDLEQKIHFLSKNSQPAKLKVEETLTKMRNEIDSHFEALQSEFNTLLSDPQVIIMDDDAEHEEYHSQTMDSQRDRAYNCIAGKIFIWCRKLDFGKKTDIHFGEKMFNRQNGYSPCA